MFDATRHSMHIKTVVNVLSTCVCPALPTWITHAHLVPLSVTYLTVHHIRNQGHLEYDLGANGLENFLT